MLDADNEEGNEKSRARGEHSGLEVDPPLERGEGGTWPSSPSSGKHAIFGLRRDGEVFGLTFGDGSSGGIELRR